MSDEKEIPPDLTKLCRDCKHFSEHVRDSNGMWQALPSCRRPGLKFGSGPDVVFGEPDWREARLERLQHKPWAEACGPAGKFFERSDF